MATGCDQSAIVTSACTPARLAGRCASRSPRFCAELLDHLRQALAFDELHRVVVDAAFDADGVDGDDVRVVERGGGAGFVLEAGQLLLVEHRGERQDLQRDAAAERELLGLVDDAHAAAAELAEDAEVAEHAGLLDARCWMLDVRVGWKRARRQWPANSSSMASAGNTCADDCGDFADIAWRTLRCLARASLLHLFGEAVGHFGDQRIEVLGRC